MRAVPRDQARVRTRPVEGQTGHAGLASNGGHRLVEGGALERIAQRCDAVYGPLAGVGEGPKVGLE